MGETESAWLFNVVIDVLLLVSNQKQKKNNAIEIVDLNPKVNATEQLASVMRFIDLNRFRQNRLKLLSTSMIDG